KNLDQGTAGRVALYLRRQANCSTPEKVVIKRVDLGGADQLQREAFLKEAEILAGLRHPNIVRLLDSFLDESAGGRQLCLVMEYASGGSLSSLLHQQSGLGLSESAVARFACQLLLALEELHSRQVLHRDLKPDNILLASTARDVCKLADFGLAALRQTSPAKDSPAGSSASGLVGTPAYLSPEVFSSDKLATAGREPSDIWALGCCLYEMCCLRRPFDADTLLLLVAQIAAGSWAPLDPRRYSPLMSDLISKMLKVDPLERPSAAQLLSHPLILSNLFPLLTDLGCVGLKKQRTKKSSRAKLATTVKRLRCRESGNRSLYLFTAGPDQDSHRLSEIAYDLPHEDLRCVKLISGDCLIGLTKRDRLVRWDRPGGEVGQPPCSWLMSDIVGLDNFRVVQLDCGDRFAACLTDAGVVLTFGCGRDGALGHGDVADLERPRVVGSLAQVSVTSVACGRRFAACVASSGEVFAWGCLPAAEAGAEVSATFPTLLPMPSGRYRALSAFAGPEALLIAAETEGSQAALLGTGWNRFGRLGLPESARPLLPQLELLPVPLEQPEESVAAASIAGNRCLLLLTSGRLLAAGRGCAAGFGPLRLPNSSLAVGSVCAGSGWALVATKAEAADDDGGRYGELLTLLLEEAGGGNEELQPLLANCRVRSLAADAAGARAAILCRRCRDAGGD
ncbi:hypothetical protein BOX15_Mlig023701g4, partial [Macrostomum lignano]